MSTDGGSDSRLRNIRVPDALWEAALSAAKAEDRPLSQVIRELLREYVAMREAAIDELVDADLAERVVRSRDRRRPSRR